MRTGQYYCLAIFVVTLFICIVAIIACFPTILSLFDNRRISEKECLAYQKDVFGDVDDAPRDVYDINPSYSHVVAIGRIDTNKQISWSCSGSLISERFVLTAIQCTITNRYPQQPVNVVRVGFKDVLHNNSMSNVKMAMKFTDYNPHDYRIERLIRYSKFNSGRDSYYNLALIKLEDEVDVGFKIRPACLWQSLELPHNSQASTFFYGYNEINQKHYLSLIEQKQKMLGDNSCSTDFNQYELLKILPSGLYEDQICTANTGGNCDQRRSTGAPLQIMEYTKDKQLYAYIVGVTAYDVQCSKLLPNIYTKIASYLDWIEEHVWE